MSQTENIPEPPLLYIPFIGMLVFAFTAVLGGILNAHYGLIAPVVEPELQPILGSALLMAGVMSAVFSFVLRSLIIKQNRHENVAGVRFRAALLGMAMAETSVIEGLVLSLLLGLSVFVFVLWVIGLAAMIPHFPTQRWLMQDNNAS